MQPHAPTALSLPTYIHSRERQTSHYLTHGGVCPHGPAVATRLQRVFKLQSVCIRTNSTYIGTQRFSRDHKGAQVVVILYSCLPYLYATPEKPSWLPFSPLQEWRSVHRETRTPSRKHLIGPRKDCVHLYIPSTLFQCSMYFPKFPPQAPGLPVLRAFFYFFQGRRLVV